jgi:hypothetical protein
MALGNNNSAIYLSISDGKIVRRFKEKTKDSVERVLTKGVNAGKTVHEEKYAFVEGLITNIEAKDSPQYGKNWIVTIQDETETYLLQMDYSSGYSSAFLKALPNVDINSKVKLSPKMTLEGDKKKATLFINQHGEAAKWAFTKDNPNGLPPMTKQKVKGKEVWDDSDMMEFLERMVNTEILPKLKSVAVELGDEEPEEKLPF